MWMICLYRYSNVVLSKIDRSILGYFLFVTKVSSTFENETEEIVAFWAMNLTVSASTPAKALVFGKNFQS